MRSLHKTGKRETQASRLQSIRDTRLVNETSVRYAHFRSESFFLQYPLLPREDAEFPQEVAVDREHLEIFNLVPR